jgi:hypothetical protein
LHPSRPAPTKQIWKNVEYPILGFFRKALEVSGAKKVSLNFDMPISEGVSFAQFSISWS